MAAWREILNLAAVERTAARHPFSASVHVLRPQAGRGAVWVAGQGPDLAAAAAIAHAFGFYPRP